MKQKGLVWVLIMSVLITLTGSSISTDSANAAVKTTKMNVARTLGNTAGFLLSGNGTTASVYIDSENEEISEGDGHEYCG